MTRLHFKPETWDSLTQDGPAERREVRTDAAIYDETRSPLPKSKGRLVSHGRLGPTISTANLFLHAHSVNAHSAVGRPRRTPSDAMQQQPGNINFPIHEHLHCHPRLKPHEDGHTNTGDGTPDALPP
ncbi:hypothetical protein SprV_0301183600 [Sparganum proliferum]